MCIKTSEMRSFQQKYIYFQLNYSIFILLQRFNYYFCTTENTFQA